MMDLNLMKNEVLVRTENGALGFESTKSKLLDVSFKIPELRRLVCNDKSVDLWDMYFKDAYREDALHTMKYILYLRDVRGGLGEREIFRNVIINMVKEDEYAYIAAMLLDRCNIPEYGRWDDIIEIAFKSDKLFFHCVGLIEKELRQDLNSYMMYNTSHKVSLLAKWMPSESTSSKESKRRARVLAKEFGWSFKDYRKNISKLRRYINVLERKMSANEWDEINYEGVPSKANLLYKKAFLRHDKERREEYLDALDNGEVKINASTLAPYEIVHKYRCNRYNMMPKEFDSTLEGLWKALPQPEKKKNILVVRDGSGSMTSQYYIPNSDLTPMDVGDSIAIYMAQNNTGCYKDKFITFSSRPQFVDLSEEKTLCDKLARLNRYNDCSNTDLERVFKLLLRTVLNYNVPPEEIPDVLIISDMEFDESVYNDYRIGNSATLMECIAAEWREKGYKLPKLIFWNVASRTGAIPMKENENGVVLVSGFSPAIANMVLNNETDPLLALYKVLDKKRYNCVEEMFSAISSGIHMVGY